MSKQSLNLVLVGFGKHDLKDMLEWRGTDQEEDLLFASHKWPPRYREDRTCDQEDLEAFAEYVAWATESINEIFNEEKINGK